MSSLRLCAPAHGVPRPRASTSRQAAASPARRATHGLTHVRDARRGRTPATAATDAPSASSKYWAERTPSTKQAQALANTAVKLAADGLEAAPKPATAFVARPATRSVLVVARSLGCPFCQALARGLVSEGVLASLDAQGTPLYLVSIGVPEKAASFCELTGFPPDRLLADADATVYAALDLERGPGAAFLSPTTPIAIGRELTGGGGAALATAFKEWKPYLPPKPFEHALHQGGTFGFAGDVCVFARADRATADHLPPSRILEVGLGLPREVE